MGTNAEFAVSMADVARQLLGEPNRGLSTRDELRYGERGSLKVDIKAGTFYDFESGEGGGVIRFIEWQTRSDKAGALQWLRDHRHLPERPKAKPKPRIVDRYTYVDESDRPLFQVQRMEPKDFRQAASDGNGGWVSVKGCMKGVRLVPYRLPQVIAAVANRKMVFVAEGEKGVHALESIGAVATCSPGGAGKWRPEYNQFFVGADVVVLPDHDPQGERNGVPQWHPNGRPVLPGQDHAAEVARNLVGIASRVRILMLPDLPLKGDIHDWIQAGGTAEKLQELATQCPAEKVAERPLPNGHDGAASAAQDDEAAHLSVQRAYYAVRDRLAKSDSDAVLPTHANLLIIMKGDPLLKDLAEFDAFSGHYNIRKAIPALDPALPPAPGPYPRPWDDDDVTRLLAYVQRFWAHNFRRGTVEECLRLTGRYTERHDVRDYLDSLKWDGVSRLDTWLNKTFGCPDDAYHRAIGAKLPIAAVRRVRQPGVKFDYVIILEGKQGIGKSTAIAVLFGHNWTTDQISDLTSKDAAVDLCGKWAIEFSEIEKLIKADDLTAKAFLSRAVDHYRPPYGTRSIDVPRQCVMMGTTNAEEYLRDITGNRRYWPAKCLGTGVNLDWLRENRDQIWAEAAHREAQGEEIWLADADVRDAAVAAQSDRMSEDSWQWKVQTYVEVKLDLYGKGSESGADLQKHMSAYPEALRGDFVTVPELLEYSLAIPTVQQSKAVEMRVASILRAIGWKRGQRRLSDKPMTPGQKQASGKPRKVWIPESAADSD
jgi:predicted P-loop ATPase